MFNDPLKAVLEVYPETFPDSEVLSVKREGEDGPVQCGWIKNPFGLSFQIVPSPVAAQGFRPTEDDLTLMKLDAALSESYSSGNIFGIQCKHGALRPCPSPGIGSGARRNRPVSHGQQRRSTVGTPVSRYARG